MQNAVTVARSETGQTVRIAATLSFDERISLSPEHNIRRPKIARRAFSRTSAEAFDPSKVSRTLSPGR